MRRRRAHGLPFVQLFHWMLNCPAWHDLKPVDRALYVEVRKRYNGFNNGQIGLGCREAGEALNVSPSTASRAFQRLIEHGFIEVAKASTFNQKKLAQEWLLTDTRSDTDGKPPSRAFMRWRLAPGR